VFCRYIIVVTKGMKMNKFEPIIEWHDAKNKANIKKHGFSFEIAQFVFLDEFMVLIDSGIVGNEQRFNAIGRLPEKTGVNVVLLVSHAHDEEDGQEYIRIISARKAVPKEVKLYEAKKSAKR
jgi:uncharacterized DUF497 family protein